MKVLAVSNMKGGVGKTSVCHHLGGTLARMGRRVLLVDNDPQSSLTQGIWGPSVALGIDPEETIAAVYSGDAFPERIVKPTGLERIDLVPGSIRSTRHNIPVPEEAEWHVQTCLRTFLEELGDHWDVVLIDNPPNLHLCTWAAFAAADFLLVPLQPEDYGAQGIAEVQASAARMVAGPNPSLQLLGILLTMINARRTVHQLYEERLRSAFGPTVFESRVPESVDFVEAVARRQPISEYKPKGAAAKAIRALADEVLARIEAHGNEDQKEAA